MNDLEICKRIAEIEGEYAELIRRRDNYNQYLVHVQDNAEFTRWFNPLYDDALCFQLMVKYEIRWGFTKCPAGSGLVHYADFNDGSGVTYYCDTPNKAICLAIIEVNNETTN